MSTAIPYSFDPQLLLPGQLAPIPPRSDRQWLYAIGCVGALLLAGVVFSFATARTLWEVTFSYRVTYMYVALAIPAIFILGYGKFPLAAAIFYGFLPVAQNAHQHHWIIGDIEAALTYEEVLAVPLLIMGLIGPNGRRAGQGRPLPDGVVFLLGAILVSALMSTVLALDPGIAAATLVSRYVLPIAVGLVCVRRLRNIQDYKTIWFGLATGLVSIGVFQFRRGVLGEVQFHLQVQQRFLGLTQVDAIPMLYVIGGALWLSVAQVRKGLSLTAILWFALTGGFVVLLWLGATRGPLLLFCVMFAWWLPTFVRQMHRPGTILLGLFGGIGAVFLARYSFERTNLSIDLMIERLDELRTAGVSGHNRAAIWRTAMEYWKTSPLFGIGPNNWVTFNTGFESPHSLIYGMLCDTGALGLAIFVAFVYAVLRASRRILPTLEDPEELAYFLGSRAGWVIMLLTLVTNLPLTSGQPRNAIFAYVAYLFPVLLLITYARHAPASPRGTTPVFPLPARPAVRPLSPGPPPAS